jgi:hypothetical protein
VAFDLQQADGGNRQEERENTEEREKMIWKERWIEREACVEIGCTKDR